MTAIRRTVLAAAALVLAVGIGLYGSFVVTTFRNLELLLMCSQGRESLIPKRLCQAYLLKFGGSSDEVADLARGIGLVWALSAPEPDDKARLLDFLIERGVPIDARDERSGLTALHAMVLDNDLEGVELLLRRGANPAVREHSGSRTPLDLALQRQGKPGEPDRAPIIARLQARPRH